MGKRKKKENFPDLAYAEVRRSSAEASSSQQAGECIQQHQLLFSSSITVYCTCYSHSSVREFPSPAAEYRSSLLPVKRHFARSFTVDTVLYRTLANSAPLYWTPPNAPVKNVQFFFTNKPETV